MSMELIYQQAGKRLDDFIRKESMIQGHHLTGTMEDSVHNQVTKGVNEYILTGYGVDYMMIVNDGIKPEDVNDKMYPGLIRYLTLRGVPDPQVAAVLVMRKWKKEGVSTIASARFSESEKRHKFIEIGIEKADIDTFISNLIDKDIDDQFNKTKPETT